MPAWCLLLFFSSATGRFTTEPLCEPGPGGPPAALVFSPHKAGSLLVAGPWGGIWRSSDGGRTYSIARSPGVPPVQTFLFHPQNPDTVLAGTLNGVVRSSDGGVTWERFGSGLPLARSPFFGCPVAVLVHVPLTPETLLAGTGLKLEIYPRSSVSNEGKLYRSEDFGRTWRLAAVGLGSVRSCAFATGRLGCLATSLGVFLSTTGGRRWTRSLQGLPREGALQAARLPGTTSFVVLLEGGGVYRSTGPTGAWEPWVQGLPEGSRVERLALSGGALYCVCSGPRSGGLWKRSAGEPSWHPIRKLLDSEPVKQTGRPLKGVQGGPGLAVWSPEYLIVERGGTFMPSSIPEEQGFRGSGISFLRAEDAAFAPGGSPLMVITADRTSWYSLDGGTHWRRLRLPEPDLVPDRVRFAGGERIELFAWRLGGPRGTRVYLTSTFPPAWRLFVRIERGPVLDFLPPEPLRPACLALFGGAVHRRSGSGWLPVLLLPPGGRRGFFTAFSPLELYLTWDGPRGGVWRSTDGGRTWLRLASALPGATGPVAKRGPELFAAALGGVWKFSGKAWERVLSLPLKPRGLVPVGSKGLVACFGKAHSGAFEPDGLWWSPGEGNKWLQLESRLGPRPVTVMRASPAPGNRVVLGTDGAGFHLLKH